ncbi:S-layer homology domain-containing protein [Sporosarcina cyprini]|uniref:S-layer homology domain-containing protein n=1 Tax=Sporosarcina cyprini TaxID=2910523 RepID=UPI001EDF6A4B|nr:S-layer homology domain-containing protein [Sporosarcina cyprini]MCG3087273.1 S-layer homology domain-containing protein [Sporosarcina cyprini]
MLEQGVIGPGSKYGVNDIVTREEVAVMVSKAVGLDGTQRNTKFPDVPKSHNSSGYISSAVEVGIINGYRDGTFKLNDKVTRGHFCVHAVTKM